MAVRLDLLAHGATAANRGLRFPDDEALDASASLEPPRRAKPYDVVLCAPARAAVETARALGFEAEVEPSLRDCDYGHWRGLGLKHVADREPEAFAAWLADPAAAPHGGESLAELVERTSAWLSTVSARRGAVLAITHAAVVRAAVVNALAAPASAFWRIDVAPLSLARLSGHAGRWNLVSLGAWGRPT
jgi:broad specificity phosphatase PhoE